MRTYIYCFHTFITNRKIPVFFLEGGKLTNRYLFILIVWHLCSLAWGLLIYSNNEMPTSASCACMLQKQMRVMYERYLHSPNETQKEIISSYISSINHLKYLKIRKITGFFPPINTLINQLFQIHLCKGYHSYYNYLEVRGQLVQVRRVFARTVSKVSSDQKKLYTFLA